MVYVAQRAVRGSRDIPEEGVINHMHPTNIDREQIILLLLSGHIMSLPIPFATNCLRSCSILWQGQRMNSSYIWSPSSLGHRHFPYQNVHVDRGGSCPSVTSFNVNQISSLKAYFFSIANRIAITDWFLTDCVVQSLEPCPWSSQPGSQSTRSRSQPDCHLLDLVKWSDGSSAVILLEFAFN